MNEMPKGRSVLIDMSHRFGMEPSNFEKVLRATVVPANCSAEQFAAFLLVAKQYNLNPITREIYAFPAKGGGIQPIVGIDGWMRIMNDHPQMDGIEFRDRVAEGDPKPEAITCLIFRKDRQHPTVVTEYLSECYRPTDAWKQWPARMLRHKAAIQAARYAFGFSGIIDPDEYERGVGKDVSHEPIMPPAPPITTFTAEQNEKSPATKLVEALDEGHNETAEIDPDAYLDELDTIMFAANDLESLAEIWTQHLAIENDLFPPDRDKADYLRQRHEARVKATIASKEARKK